jgi:DNA-binding NarL/FixJ family response regulator
VLSDPIHTGTGPAAASQPGEAAPARRVMLMVAMPGVVSTSLIRALELEFPWIVVEQRPDIFAACQPFDEPLALILCEAHVLPAVEAISSEILRIHPLASAAVIEQGDREPSFRLKDVLSSRLVRGILPMSLKLDVWLSVVRLLLHGGEYFPARMLFSQIAREAASSPVSGTISPPYAISDDDDLATLTARELQILEMVARGLQHRTIAAEFSLSEHTVKVHLHNIIGKLGVRNRSEAAACFRKGMNLRADGMFRIRR